MKTLIIIAFAVISVFLIWHPRGKEAFSTFCYAYYCGFKQTVDYLKNLIKNPIRFNKDFPEENIVPFYIVFFIAIIFIWIKNSTKTGILYAFKTLRGDYVENE